MGYDDEDLNDVDTGESAKSGAMTKKCVNLDDDDDDVDWDDSVGETSRRNYSSQNQKNENLKTFQG